MIIANSSIGMDSARTYTSVSQDSKQIHSVLIMPFKEKLTEISDKDVNNKKGNKGESELSNYKQSFNDIFDRMKAYQTSGSFERKLEADALNRIKTQCIQYLMFILFGKRFDEESIVAQNGSGDYSSSPNQFIATTSSTTSFYAEQESTSFQTSGTVVTSDGREINFNLDLSMSRSFASYYEENISSVQAFTDPLVINLDSSIADVSDVKVMFDLDCDGEIDNISQLGSGSGYLALDNNNDGIINDGSELFGTTSGNGFADLAKFDADNNGWIDEADDVFDKLKICVLNEDGSQTLYSLKDKNVGAICLQNAQTDFSLNNLQTNEVNARIRSTGIFLYENGELGTIQHLDLAQ